MRDPLHYLEDILESMTLIERFVEGMELDEFRNDIKTSYTVIKRFENIGEATNGRSFSLMRSLPI